MSCSSARSRVRARVLECSCAWSSARVLMRVVECSSARASYVGRSEPQKFSFFGFLLFAPSSVCCCKIVSQGQFSPLTPSLALFRSTLKPCWDTAAASPTARMRRVRQPMLHFSSSIRCDDAISVSVLCARIRVRVCRRVRVGVMEPHISFFFFFFALLAAAAYSYGHYACLDHCYACVVMTSACMRCVYSVYVQPRYNSKRTTNLCGPLLCVC